MPSVTYARRTESSCLASATASVVAIAAVGAWDKVDGTGLARLPVTERLLSRSAKEAISTKEGVTCPFPTTTVTSPWSALEEQVELKEDDEPYPLERPVAPSLRPPVLPRGLPPRRLPRPELRPWLRPEPPLAQDSPPPPPPPLVLRAGGGSRHPHLYRCHPTMATATPGATTSEVTTPGATTLTAVVHSIAAAAAPLRHPAEFLVIFLRCWP